MRVCEHSNFGGVGTDHLLPKQARYQLRYTRKYLILKKLCSQFKGALLRCPKFLHLGAVKNCVILAAKSLYIKSRVLSINFKTFHILLNFIC